MNEHQGFQKDQPNSQGETCWSCGHWLIGCGCWKEGSIHMPGWVDTCPEDSCEEWVDEDTPRCINAQIKEYNAEVRGE